MRLSPPSLSNMGLFDKLGSQEHLFLNRTATLTRLLNKPPVAGLPKCSSWDSQRTPRHVITYKYILSEEKLLYAKESLCAPVMHGLPLPLVYFLKMEEACKCRRSQDIH